MNYAQNKEQELLGILENLERSYSPSSPQYKFSHIFYNIVDGPFERPYNFPEQLWAQSLLPDRTLMPVILSKPQIDERKAMQNDLIRKLNESRGGIHKRIEAIRAKREALRAKLVVVCSKYRRVSRQYQQGDANEEVYRMQIDVAGREKYLVKNSRAEVMDCLVRMRERLLGLEREIVEALGVCEKRHISDYQLDRF